MQGALLTTRTRGLDEFAALKTLGMLCGLAVIALGMALARSLLQTPQAHVNGSEPHTSSTTGRTAV